jgi:HNH endonuclease
VNKLSYEDNPDMFWAKIDKRGPNDCWKWLGSINSNGYGIFGKSNKYAHRHVFYLNTGRKPQSGFFICHTCNNKTCCNPLHLYEGTAFSNMQDILKAGKHGGGPRPKLNPMTVQEMHARGLSMREIGRQLGASHNAVKTALRPICKP